ncbi:hypothetical protein ACQ86B_28700 (plasmid) [Mycolicibacterium aichiense]|uniref:hypothetical protein n=1 Tax=Mycolicibacterium aichiense TaxID=1799 RepID=UPI003D674307
MTRVPEIQEKAPPAHRSRAQLTQWEPTARGQAIPVPQVLVVIGSTVEWTARVAPRL